eukprot:c25663_g1_i1 orf=849-2447(-)
MMCRGGDVLPPSMVGCSAAAAAASSSSSSRSSLATTLLLSALLLTATFAWLFLLLSSRHACTSTSIRLPSSHSFDSLPSPFPWQSPDWDSDPLPAFESRLSLPSARRRRQAHNRSHFHLRNLVFGIAGSAKLWPRRREFVKLWWKPRYMRGFVWLDEPVRDKQAGAQLPLLMVSEDTSSFPYTHPVGNPSGIRIARVLVEMFRLGLPDVHWFVLGDDDTIFCTDNLMRVLSKYDPNEMYYIGDYSESHYENFIFSYNMAYGGGGVAISYPLAEVLSGTFDACIQRYPQLFGSDDRLHACITELGIPITRETGFHQFDIRGSAFGLLAAHPVTPFISLHHVEMLNPLFPELERLDGLRLLAKAMQIEPGSFLQQSICYQPNYRLSFSISLGYVVQVFPKIISPRELQRPERTFKAWNGLEFEAEFDINTRPAAPSVCDQPYNFFLEEIHIEEGTGQVVSTYKRDSGIDDRKRKAFCWSPASSPVRVQYIHVVSKPLDWHWYLVPRRHCCTLGRIKDMVMHVTVESCQGGIAVS